MLAMVGLPIIPLVFNRLIRRLRSLKNLMSNQPSDVMAGPPRLQVRTSVLLQGLAMTAFGWMLLGASLWAVLQAVLDEPRWMTLAEWGRLSAILSLSYVAGFIIVLIPSGLGIREFFLHMFLIPELSLHWTGEGGSVVTAVWAVLLLRVVWTAAEIVTAAVVYGFPRERSDQSSVISDQPH
jgi:hypothetical protein